ncbi:phospholipase A1-like [Ochlerotatus camptorhynchus]|uniref:phospholipase A1-like n=1 Tax=Ochlerotatus camptorhynchus TaxID=644619 RepID=UPI0031E180F3
MFRLNFQILFLALKFISASLEYALNWTELPNEADWIQVPNPTWQLTWVHRSVVEAQNRVKWGSNEVDVSFVFFSRENDSGATFRLSDIQNVDESSFDASRPTRVIVHGWMNHRDSPLNVQIRKTYLSGWDYNVIVVDWSSCAGRMNYIAAAACVKTVGEIVGRMLWQLRTSKRLLLDDVYVIGHSLGAHVAGVSGKTVGRARLSTIVALDPALPLFSGWHKDNRVDKDDAKYVEVIHTNGGLLGFLEPIGTADFYPNGGVVQPGCGINFAGICAHSRAWELFVESLIEPEEYLMATQILSIGNLPFIGGYNTNNTNNNKLAKMGGNPSNSNGQADGLYYMITSDTSPYFVPNKPN